MKVDTSSIPCRCLIYTKYDEYTKTNKACEIHNMTKIIPDYRLKRKFTSQHHHLIAKQIQLHPTTFFADCMLIGKGGGRGNEVLPNLDVVSIIPQF